MFGCKKLNYLDDMKTYYLTVLLLLLFLTSIEAQKDRRLNREGVKEYNREEYDKAEISFRKALDLNQKSFAADYNIANSLYKQKKYKDASEKYDSLSKKEPENVKMADIYHNLGNSLLEANQFDKSIEAYKNSLRLRPEDEDTRYNLAYAQAKLKQQQEQRNQNKDSDKKEDNKDDKKKDEQDQKNKPEQDQDKDRNNADDQKKEQDEQQKPNELTKHEAEQILEAIQNQEKEVKEKVDRKKALVGKSTLQKDW